MPDRHEFEALERRARLIAKVAFIASGFIILTSLVRQFVNVFIFNWFTSVSGSTLWQGRLEERAGIFRSVAEVLALVFSNGVVPALVVSLLAVIALVITRRASAGGAVFAGPLERDFARRARLFAVVAEVYAWAHLAFVGGMLVISGAAAGLWFQTSSMQGAGDGLMRIVQQLSYSAQEFVSTLLRFTGILLAALVVKALAGPPPRRDGDYLEDMEAAPDGH